MLRDTVRGCVWDCVWGCVWLRVVACVVDKRLSLSLCAAQRFTPHAIGVCAQMAELVDAPASGAGARKGVEVRVLFWAPFPQDNLHLYFAFVGIRRRGRFESSSGHQFFGNNYSPGDYDPKNSQATARKE